MHDEKKDIVEESSKSVPITILKGVFSYKNEFWINHHLHPYHTNGMDTWRRPLSISDSYSMWSRDSRRAGIANGRAQEDVPRAYHGQEAMLRATYPPGCRGRVPSIIGGTCRRVPFSFDFVLTCTEISPDSNSTLRIVYKEERCALIQTHARAHFRG